MTEPHESASGEATQGSDYTERLAHLEGARWKQVLDVQAPYRWNLRRLHLGRTLDVGCGIGRNLTALDDAVGVDHNATSIDTARQRGLRCWTTEQWPDCPDAQVDHYDAMLLAHVLEHVQAAEGDEIIRGYLPYLRDNARLVLICPQEKGYTTDATHVRFVDFEEMVATAERLGFAVERRYSFPLPRMAGRVFPYNEFVVVARRVVPRRGH
jgi:2-polyprenyl-3-methyl-5-hydroxy-6-metoxy-1,4-benzoquinol methylase